MMGDQLRFVSILPLQVMALRKVAVILWNEPRTLVSVGNFRYRSDMPYDSLENWHDTFGPKVSKKILELQLPKSVAKQMVQVLKPIGLQMMRWKLLHEYYLMAGNEFFDVPVLEKLQWTATGTVDYRKTAEELVRCDVLDIVKRYKLGCLYCLDHYIPELWKELPQDDKRIFYFDEYFLPGKQVLIYSWPYILRGENYKLDLLTLQHISFNQFAFQHSSSLGNKAAAQYFLQKLSPQERENSIVTATESALKYQSSDPPSFPNTNDVVFYLLSEMTPEQRIQVFRKKPAEVLGCFFNWKWHDAFLDFSDTLWTWIQCEDQERRMKTYDILLDKMQSSIRNSDCCLSSLYQNLFLSSPRDFRKYLVEHKYSFINLTMKLVFAGDAETLNVILSNLDAGDGLRLASSRQVLALFHIIISRGQGRAVETCLRGLSKEDKASLKEVFVKFLKKKEDRITKLETLRWRRFFDFLDETDVRAQAKRNSDDEILVEAKKLCCEEK